ncbi:putative chorismate mutase [Grifola frondosa]|uniref:chorismate mutase n=1 Tax=Grifola frondosa TaxID=5627 RepID=A0A1C7M4E6_GRIFR|nr:putative chorismate mutase [Grifola frondosa]
MSSVPLPETNFTLATDPLSLDRIRAILTRLEDTIIFSLIERAQFAHNPKAYRRGSSKSSKKSERPNSKSTQITRSLRTPRAHSQTPRQPRDPLPNKINVNASILSFYTRSIVPRITQQATLALAALKRANASRETGVRRRRQLRQSAFVDLEVLQAISKRVHYVEFKSNPAVFISHIQSRNRAALEALITKPEVSRSSCSACARKRTSTRSTSRQTASH